MQEDRNVPEGAPEADQDFSRFLKQVRTEAKVSLKKLSEGLMSASQLARIEKGQRSVCKDMRDRLLGRMGISSDLYENLLNIEDFTAWEQQRNILGAMEQRAFLRAQELIAAYERQQIKGIKDKIRQQFCLVIRAEILRQQGAEQCEIADCYEKAVKLTVPKVDSMCVGQKLLSIQEVNMVLEYEFYHRDAGFVEKCRELMAFVENSLYDDLSKAKIYPKIVCYYLREIFSDQNKQPTDIRESLEICNRAIALLRDTGRAYFLLELLEMRIKIMRCIENDLDVCAEAWNREQFGEAYQESVEMLDLLKRLYAEYEVPAYMQDCAYLYQQRWVFYVGDVLRIRRKMFGMTQEELCGEDCSVKSLRRTEKMEANMQHEALGVLLRKLGLSKEFQRTSIVTNDGKVIKLSAELAIYRNNHDVEKIKSLLRQIKERISAKIPENRQYFMELEASLDWMEGKIAKEELAAREEKALQCTLNIKSLFHAKEIYLTEMEMVCIRQMVQGLRDLEKRKYIDLIMRFFESFEKRYAMSDYVIMYEYVMMYVASELGNMGEWKLAIEINKKVMRMSLMCRRVWEIGNNLYDILWNEKEQKIKNGQVINKEKMTERLKQCVRLSHFCRQSFGEHFFLEKMYQL